MLRTGLVSITFRKLSPEEIIELVSQAKLEAVEWGGDVHVPHGNLVQARKVRKLTSNAGLQVASYGSYYRVGEDNEVSFMEIVDTASELGAPMIRVWAGRRGSKEADEDYVKKVIDESQKAADLAGEHDLVVAYEYHANTLTDTAGSTRRLLRSVNHDNMKTYWQPPSGKAPEECLKGLQQVSPWLTNIHAFYWWPTGKERHLLEEGEEPWLRYLSQIAETGREHFVLIEFVRKEDPDNFLKDALTLRKWAAQIEEKHP